MPRFTIEGDPIHIAYGVDDDQSSGVFLSVYDNRLMWHEKASKEVNQVAESVGIKDGSGCYFDLHTGLMGFGKKVSKETIRMYLARYGVTKKRIDELFNWSYGKPIGSTCSVCYKEETKTCSQCNKNYYCSKECQTKDWPTHKLFCLRFSSPLGDLVSKSTSNDCSVCFKTTNNLCGACGLINFCSKECQIKEWSIHKLVCDALPFPEKILTGKHVYAFYLPEDAEKVVLAQVLIESKFDEDDGTYWDCPKLEPFIGDGCRDQRYMMSNQFNKSRVMKDMLIIFFRDAFLKDGSKSNKLVKKMTSNFQQNDWRGPMLILKAKGTILESNQHYLDVDLKDFSHVIDFFLSYGKNFD